MSSQESKSRSGRFDLPANELVEKFNATIPFEQRVCPFDIKDSQTHAAMLARQGIISEADAQAICRGLDQVAEEIRSGKFVFTVKDEDIHMAIEKRMTEIVGPAGGRLHTGRSRNDQTTTSTKMYLRHVIREVQEAIRGLQAECVAVARANADVIMPGFTHMQTGQPILFAHWMMAFFWMLERDFTRFGDLYKRMGRCPLGSAALAGTDFPIDRDFTAKALGFDGPTENSIDTLLDSLAIVTPMIAKMKVNAERTRRAADMGYANATDLADYLAKKGIPFREAHHIVGSMVNYAIKHNKRLDDFTMDEYRQFSDKIEEDIREEISLETCVKARRSFGGTAPERVREQLEHADKVLSEEAKALQA